MGRIIIGMDPHKRSATIEMINDREKVLAEGRLGTDRDDYQAMLKLGRHHKDRIWAVEDCNGIGRHIAQRLVADGETVLDVPAKLSARARLFDTGQGRKTDPVDVHCVAVAALRANGLPQVVVDTTVALKLLVDRRDGLGRASLGEDRGAQPAAAPAARTCCGRGEQVSCPRSRPGRCSTRFGPATSSVAPAGSWLLS
jgi:hypothetical protein